MTITVSQDDIEQGQPLKGLSCPIALAIKRATGLEYVGVGVRQYWYKDLAGGVLPPEVTEFVKAFDSGKPVEPFTFELEDLKS